jgi:DNA-directed RNA polymerase subunit H (RpoH/RPB5)
MRKGSIMEDKALATLRIFFERRKLATDTKPLATELKDVSAYTMGDILVLFSQKDKMLDRDVKTYLGYAGENEYKNGVVIISLSKPSENLLNIIRSQYSKEKVAFFHIRELQMDITTHRMSVPHRILPQEEAKAVLDKNRVVKPEDQLPWIDSQDIQARIIGAVPGDIIEITRHSDTVGKCTYYRYCVADVNVA